MAIYLGDTPLANTGYDKANTDLSNLKSTGKNIANWSNNITNCITEIPQDIKLEFANGTLTLKAGSRLYDGLGNSYTVPNDMSFSSASGSSTQQFMLIKSDLSGALFLGLSDTNASYNSTTGLIEYPGLGTYLLPVAITSHSSATYTGIDQVFNGFGYIGSTVFALPGVKGLIPNGRNEDGTLKNIDWTANKVIAQTLTFGAHSYYFGVYNNNQELAFYGKTVTKYDEKSNTIIDTYPDPDVIRTGWSFFGECTADSNNRITSLTPKTVFHAVDYNDSSIISGWSMPSSRYIDLTLGATGSTYTAPANGWVLVGKQTNGTSLQNIYIKINGYPWGICWTSGGYNAFVYAPVCKGQIFNVNYTAGGATQVFRFVYAVGEGES